MTHFKSYNAPLCKDMTEEEQKTVIWYPGEEICKGRPQKDFQREQKRIERARKRGVKMYDDKPYTANQLTKMKNKRKRPGQIPPWKCT